MGNLIKLSLEKTLENSVKGQYYKKSNETSNNTDFIPDPMMVWFIFIFLDFCVCVLAQSQFFEIFSCQNLLHSTIFFSKKGVKFIKERQQKII